MIEERWWQGTPLPVSMKAAVYTLGCKVNQYETQAMLEALENSGYEIVRHNEPADVYIVNSCTVTSVSDQKTRSAVNTFKRLHPESVVVLTGCMPQAYPQMAGPLPCADIVLGNRNNGELIRLLDEYFQSGQKIFNVQPHTAHEDFAAGQIGNFHERTRAIVKIEDGCNRFCSYCIIPTARGRVRSRSLDNITSEIENLVNAGYREMVLVGINLSAYGQDTGQTLADAVDAACSVPGIQRVRLGSLEPDHITEDLISRLATEKKLCPQFHISLQSGCNSTLQRMNRHYTTEEYEALCGDLRSAFKNAALTTDVMVGFPGESDEEFAISLNFVKKIGFAKVHVFSYSRRAGTRAAEMPDQISNAVKKLRSRIMIDETEKIRRKFLLSQTDTEAEVLFETADESGNWTGYSPNYTPVSVMSNRNLSGKLTAVRITGALKDGCVGDICENK